MKTWSPHRNPSVQPAVLTRALLVLGVCSPNHVCIHHAVAPPQAFFIFLNLTFLRISLGQKSKAHWLPDTWKLLLPSQEQSWHLILERSKLVLPRKYLWQASAGWYMPPIILQVLINQLVTCCRILRCLLLPILFFPPFQLQKPLALLQSFKTSPIFHF